MGEYRTIVLSLMSFPFVARTKHVESLRDTRSQRSISHADRAKQALRTVHQRLAWALTLHPWGPFCVAFLHLNRAEGSRGQELITLPIDEFVSSVRTSLHGYPYTPLGLAGLK